MIAPADDLFHEGIDDPYWNESAWFSFTVPELGLQGMIYCFHRPNMGLTCAGPILWDSLGATLNDCLFSDWFWLQALPSNSDMHDFSLPGSLTVEQLTPLGSYRFRYSAQDCEIDLQWDSVMDPHEVTMSAAAFAPGTSHGELARTKDWTGEGHYEQVGRMHGAVKLRGEVLAINCLSMRDRSWGRRRVELIPKCDYLWGIESEASSFHLVTVNKGAEEQEEVVAGYLMQDGVIADLVGGVRHIDGRRDGVRAVAMTIEVEDSLGRRFEAYGSTVNCLLFSGYPRLLVSWCLVKWQIDGRTVWGEQQETFPIEDARRLLRRAASVGALEGVGST